MHLEVHVNANPEMNVWYPCTFCEYVTPSYLALKNHLAYPHNHYVTIKHSKDNIIDDDHEVESLKRKRVEALEPRRNPSEKSTNPSRNPSEKSTNFIPVDSANFRERVHQLTCQYCGFSSEYVKIVDKHVNAMHEMTIWYKCIGCDYTTMRYSNLRTHLSNQHGFEVDKNGPESLRIKNQDEIDELKKKKILKQTSIEEPSDLSLEQLKNHVKEEIEIVEHSTSAINLYDVGNLFDSDEEFSVESSW